MAGADFPGNLSLEAVTLLIFREVINNLSCCFFLSIPI